jgi:hypothetical protein
MGSTLKLSVSLDTQQILQLFFTIFELSGCDWCTIKMMSLVVLYENNVRCTNHNLLTHPQML